MNDTVRLADRSASSQQASAPLHPLPFDRGAREDERLANLRNVHAFVEHALGREDLDFAVLERPDDALRLVAAGCLFRRELMKQDVPVTQQPVDVVELVRSLVRGVD